MGDNGRKPEMTRHLRAGAMLLCILTPTAAAGQVSYSRDIAPIVRQHCSPCHRPGAVAPFSLLTFEDSKAKAGAIADVTGRRVMPPWKPVHGVGGPFAGERRLSDAQIDAIRQWVDAGAPAEDVAPDVASVSDSVLGTPDLVVTLPAAYTLSAEGPDVFRNFVVPIPTEGVQFVEAIEFRTNGARSIHHVNLRIDRTASSRNLDAADPLPGYEGPVGANARYPDGYFLGWTPGQLPTRAPAGLAWRLAPRSDLVMQLHLRKGGSAEQVQPSVAFFFTKQPSTRSPLALRLGRQNIDIAPGARMTMRDSYQLPVDVEVHAIHPHAHFRARDVKAFADLPDGTRRWLIHIDDWDFNWQDVYRFQVPVPLPRGTTIHSEFTYDNTANNPRNPDSPPRRVIFGQNSSDEMGDLWLQVLPRNAQDRAILYRDVYPKTVAEDAAGLQMILRTNPNHAGYRRDLANTQYNLGTLEASRGRYAEAVSAFSAALETRPDHAGTHNNLGAVLKALGKLDQAIEHFKKALALDSSNNAARENLEKALALKR
jgi:mono/diheme cytochrome c family protein